MGLTFHLMAIERVQQRLRRVTAALDAAGVPYAVVGGNTWWLSSAAVAMSDDMERLGIIDAARAAELRAAETTAYNSTGSFLMQGRDRAMLTGLYTLSAIAVIGFGTLAAMTRPSNRATPRGTPPNENVCRKA